MCLAACTPAPAPAPLAPARPTIVSLNPCADAVLAEVADPAQLLAISHYSHDPRSTSMDLATARRFRAVGGTVEEVMALKPDVVVSGTLLAPSTRAAFERLGIRVELVPIATNVAESEAQVRALAAVSGHAERGEAMVAQIDAALAQAAPAPGEVPVPALVWQSGGIVPGQGTLITDLLARTGFASFSAARGMGQADVMPLETLLADPPRVILTAGDVHGEEDRMLAHPALAELTGTLRAPFAPSLLYCGGPTIVKAAQRLAEVRAWVRGQPAATVIHEARPREGGGLPQSSGPFAARGPRLRGDAVDGRSRR
jgi:iron complex transport system substrate-binding protein